MSDVHAFEADSPTDQRVSPSQYKGKVLLIMNTASKYGFTPQYAGLKAMYKRLHDKGLEMLGFPYNQLDKQKPGSADKIGVFYEKNYGISFPMFGKTDVNGSNVHPLYKWLTSERSGALGIGTTKWDFIKLLLCRDDTAYRRYAPLTKPEEIVDDIERLLMGPDPA